MTSEYFRVSMPRVWHEYIPMGAIYHMPERHPILVFWENGQIVWSQDSSRGGPPYWRGGVDEDRVLKLLDNLEALGAFNSPVRDWCYDGFGFGGSSFVISIAAGSRRLRMTSYRRVPIPREHSTSELDQQFRQHWCEIDSALTSLCPDTGKDVGKLEFEIDWLP